MTPPLIATLAWLCLLGALLLRKNTRWHVLFAALGLGLDLILVIYLELTRNVLAKSITADLSGISRAHIAASASAFLLYFPLVCFGLAALLRQRGGKAGRIHQQLGLIAFALRTAGFLLMVAMIYSRNK